MRWALRAVGLVSFLVVFVAATGTYLVARSLPNYSASVEVVGLAAPVEIVRSAEAIPHIFGETDVDVYFGLGYAHAQDRFWQMEMFRRTAQGRLSELVGPATLSVDELLRRFDLYGAAKSSVDVQTAYARAALEAYSAGINARLEEASGWGELAPEFLLFPVEIEPWQPADTLALLKLLALQLASHVDREVLRARVSSVVSPQRLRDILPDDPNTGIAAMPEYSQLFPDVPDAMGPAVALAPYLSSEISSNAWAAGPTRTESGLPLLANDPHLDFAAPAVFYLARLDLKDGAVIGATVPGIPSILSGRRDGFSWGLTAANMDDQDVFIEKLNPENPNEVLTPEGYKPLRTRRETIRVRASDPLEIELRWSENGPVIPGKYYNLDKITPEGHVAVIARTLFDPADTSLSAAHDLQRATSIEEAIAGVDNFVTPAQNLTMADRDGIALQMIGRMPRRVEGHSTLGRMPSEGWIATNRWHGTLAYLDNPRFVDPFQGVVGNTNSKTLDRPFPFHVSFDWGDSWRIRRWEERMAAREKHNRESFVAAQNDLVSFPARTLLPLLKRTLGSVTGRQEEAMALLDGWDAAMLADRPEPLIYAAWMRALQWQLAADELGDLIDEFDHPNPTFLQRVLSDTDGAAAWCDDAGTVATESCEDAVRAALDRALDRLAERPGGTLVNMRWGDLHQATHDHPVLGRLPVIGQFVNIRQSTGGSDNTLLRGLTRGTGEEPLRNKHGALYRSVIDMAQPESSVFVISTGQSGHPLSSHYRDLGALWRDGRYVSMGTDTETVRSTAQGVTRLMPK